MSVKVRCHLTLFESLTIGGGGGKFEFEKKENKLKGLNIQLAKYHRYEIHPFFVRRK